MTSQLTINLIVIFLGLVGLTGTLGGVVVALAGASLDDTVKVLAGAAVGGLGSLLARTATEPMPPSSTTNIVADTVERAGGSETAA